jgi:signal transduction histidine kinase/ligand-binding sensor domain-containing protein/ActR/RegA family two-component response regulator
MFLQINTINSDNGLPNEQIHAVNQDRFGRLWMATPAGLACYNGNNIKVYDTRTGLDCLGLRTINITDDGIIWIGTDRGLEAIDITGKKNNLTINFTWKYGIAESIFKNEDALFVGTSYGLLTLSQTNEIVELESADDFGLVKQIIAKDNHTILLVSAKYGLIEYKSTGWKIVNKVLSYADFVTCIHKTIDNFFLVGTLNGLYLLNRDYEIVEHFSLPNMDKKITAITILGDEWWLAFGHTIVLVKPSIEGIKYIDSENVKSIINDLFVDNTNNIWLATNNAGLKKISILRKILEQIDCGINNSAFSVQEINKKQHLVIGGDGFSAIVAKTQEYEKTTAKIISTFPTIVWDTCIDPIDKSLIWLATVDGLFTSKNGEKPIRFEDKNNIINSPNRVLLTRDNEIWLGTVSGLYKITDNTATEVFNNTGNEFGYVYCLTLDVNNDVLIGTLGQGLWREAKAGIINIVTDHISEKGNTYSVVPNKVGDILIIQEEKVIVLDKTGKSRLIATEHPIAGWTSVWINTTTIATGSNDGIIIIDIDLGIVQQRINLHLTKAAWQFTSTRALLLDDDGKLFCCLNAGLYKVDYKNIQQYNKAPKVRLDEIVWQNINPQKNTIGYKISTGNWSVNVSVFAAWFTDERQVRYRFKLVGFNEDWSELDDSPSIRFSSLPAGKYELQCQAYTALTNYGAIETIMFMRVYNPWGNFGIGPVMSRISIAYDKIFNTNHRNRLLLEKNKDLQIEIKERESAEQSLNKYKEQLEEIVANRTAELKFQKERAESADKMKSTFLANMSHEIRTPLGVVIGLNNLLQKTKPNRLQSDYISKIDSSAHHLLQIINDILDIAKIESGKIEKEEIPFFLENILKDLYSYAEINVGEKYIAFFIENNISTKNQLVGDELKLKQVLLNLLSNAVKFTEKGKITLTIKEELKSDNNIHLFFSVKDSGIGMNEAQLEKVFEAFEQGDSSITRKYGGTGLGLNICFKLIALMSGELNVKSEVGRGSEFYFSVPLKTISDKDLDEQYLEIENHYKTNYPIGFENIKQANILVAEDDVLNQFILKQILQTEGFNITFVNNGVECIALVKEKNNFDLILMDIQMPELDGFGATNFIRNELKNNETKIIGISANAFSETKEKILSSGMNDFIAKPINTNELFSILVKWIVPKNEII